MSLSYYANLIPGTTEVYGVRTAYAIALALPPPYNVLLALKYRFGGGKKS